MLVRVAAPVGTIRPWIRPDNTIPLPFGWLICDGSTVSDSSSSFDGKTIPDLRGQFPEGHATLTNANFGADALYFTGGTVPSGGVDSINLSHSHGTPGHTHSFSGTTNVSSNVGNPVGWISPPTFVHTHSHTATGTTVSSTPATGAALGSFENRPAYIELVTLIRIK